MMIESVFSFFFFSYTLQILFPSLFLTLRGYEDGFGVWIRWIGRWWTSFAGGVAALSYLWFRCSQPRRCCSSTIGFIYGQIWALTKFVTEYISVAGVILTQCSSEVYGVREGNRGFSIPSVLSSLSHSIHRLTNIALIGSVWFQFLITWQITWGACSI